MNFPLSRRGIQDDYEILAPLGKGSSARVFLGVHIPSAQKVVVKIFKKIPKESILKEIEINRALLSHKDKEMSIIPLLDWCQDVPSQAYTLIYQYFPGVPLNTLI